jgi:hypothetical protein
MAEGMRRETPTTSQPGVLANRSTAACPTSPDAPAISTLPVINRY